MNSREQKIQLNMRKVAEYLHGNPAARQSDVTRETGLSKDQVDYAIEKLTQDENVQRSYKVDLRFLGYKERYGVDICLSPAHLRDGHGGLPEDSGVNSQAALALYILRRLPDKEKFRGKILVEDVRILLGSPADLSATVRATDTKAMRDFVTEGLRMCGAVTHTQTCHEAWSAREGDL